ncbi:MAG: DUF1015 domain-containing protein [Spirochaetaceae bacterium]|nr:DUF1015 domain-containing protein [Spirochaetaceae bacterium]
MTIVRPFRGVRYDPARVDLSRVIVPPYDVVAADERAAFFDADPHNAIRFELTRDVADEAAADYGWIRETFDAWLREGVLLRDEKPAYYVMGQRYEAPSGETLERVGFFGELALEDYETRVVRPHERTLAGPKADRLKLLRAAEANLSSVFLLYEDREDELGALLARALEEAAIGRAEHAGVEYRLARLDEPSAVARIRDFLDARPTVIADGHHRYETALEYRRERRAAAAGSDPDAPWESTIAYFANAWAPGSLLLPIHRVVRDGRMPDEAGWRAALPGWRIERLADVGLDEVEGLLARTLAPLAGQAAFVAEARGGPTLLLRREAPLGDELMVRVLEREVLGPVFGLDPEAIRGGAVHFPKSARRAGQAVRDGEGRVALYLNPLTPDDVFRVTAQGEVMPQKSTFFYPKIPTGMVFRDHRPLRGARV